MPTPSPTPTRAALYARVSTTGHGQDVGPSSTLLRQVAAARGWVVVEEFVDEASGTKITRPGLDAMLEACRLGKVDVIAFWRLDCSAAPLPRRATPLDELADLKVDIRQPPGRRLRLHHQLRQVDVARPGRLCGLRGQRHPGESDRRSPPCSGPWHPPGRPKVEMDLTPALALLEKATASRRCRRCSG
ncbi:MAG: recombinase family protein [bacterium]